MFMQFDCPFLEGSYSEWTLTAGQKTVTNRHSRIPDNELATSHYKAMPILFLVLQIFVLRKPKGKREKNERQSKTPS